MSIADGYIWGRYTVYGIRPIYIGRYTRIPTNIPQYTYTKDIPHIYQYT